MKSFKRADGSIYIPSSKALPVLVDSPKLGTKETGISRNDKAFHNMGILPKDSKIVAHGNDINSITLIKGA